MTSGWVADLENPGGTSHHSVPTGARNSSLGHPNMAEASPGKNFPKVIPSLLHVWMILAAFGHLMRIFVQTREYLVWTTAHHQTKKWHFIKGCPNLNFCSVAGCPNLISGMPETRERCPNLTNKFSYWCKGIPVRHHLKMRLPKTSCSVLWMSFPTLFICILWPRFVSLQQRKWIQYKCTLLPKHLYQMSDVITRMLIQFRE